MSDATIPDVAAPRQGSLINEDAFGERVPEFDNELSPAIYGWLKTLTKATKAVRVYELNNQMLRQFIDRAHDQLAAIHEQAGDLALTIREDRLLFGKDPVLINADRQEGIPFILYRNALRRLTFTKGMSRDEIIALLKAITTDFSALDYQGEDLVTALWRLQLPSIRYFAIDALSVAVDSTSDSGRREQAEIDRLQGDIDDLVAAIYGASTSDDDFVKNVAITKEDLEALKDIREESAEDLELLDVATARAVTALPEDALEKAALEQREESHESLLERLNDLLVETLYKQQRGDGFGATLELVQQLIDSVLLAGRYGYVQTLVERLRRREEIGDDLTELHVTRHLLRMLALETRLAPVLERLKDGSGRGVDHDILSLIRAFGTHVVSTLVRLLDTLPEPAQRRAIVAVINEYGTPDAAALLTKMETAKSFIMPDLLTMAANLPLEELAPIVLLALENDYPRVRMQAIGMLRKFPKGTADALLTSALSDEETDVRLKAYRVAAARKSQEAKSTIRVMLLADDVFERDMRELRTMTAAIAAIDGEQAIPLLSRLLNPGLFARRKQTDAQVAAAFALAQIANEEAEAEIKKGARTVNTKVRDACKNALEPGAAEANIATFLGEDLMGLLANFVGSGDQNRDYLKEAQEQRRKKKLTPAEEAVVRRSSPAEDEDFGSVRRPHNAPDVMPETLPNPQPELTEPKAGAAALQESAASAEPQSSPSKPPSLAPPPPPNVEAFGPAGSGHSDALGPAAPKPGPFVGSLADAPTPPLPARAIPPLSMGPPPGFGNATPATPLAAVPNPLGPGRPDQTPPRPAPPARGQTMPPTMGASPIASSTATGQMRPNVPPPPTGQMRPNAPPPPTGQMRPNAPPPPPAPTGRTMPPMPPMPPRGHTLPPTVGPSSARPPFGQSAPPGRPLHSPGTMTAFGQSVSPPAHGQTLPPTMGAQRGMAAPYPAGHTMPPRMPPTSHSQNRPQSVVGPPAHPMSPHPGSPGHPMSPPASPPAHSMSPPAGSPGHAMSPPAHPMSPQPGSPGHAMSPPASPPAHSMSPHPGSPGHHPMSPAHSMSPPASPPAHSMSPPAGSPGHPMSPPAGSPGHAMSPPASPPAHSMSPPAGSPGYAMSPPAGSPGHAMSPPAGSPGHAMSPPAGSPGHAMSPPASPPAHSMSPPAGSPGHAMSPHPGSPAHPMSPHPGSPGHHPMSPAHSMSPPASPPAHSMSPPASPPAHSMSPPAGSPGHSMSPPAGSPGHAMSPPASPPAYSMSPPAGSPGHAMSPPAGSPGHAMSPPGSSAHPMAAARSPSPSMASPSGLSAGPLAPHPMAALGSQSMHAARAARPPRGGASVGRDTARPNWANAPEPPSASETLAGAAAPVMPTVPDAPAWARGPEQPRPASASQVDRPFESGMDSASAWGDDSDEFEVPPAEAVRAPAPIETPAADEPASLPLDAPTEPDEPNAAAPTDSTEAPLLVPLDDDSSGSTGAGERIAMPAWLSNPPAPAQKKRDTSPERVAMPGWMSDPPGPAKSPTAARTPAPKPPAKPVAPSPARAGEAPIFDDLLRAFSTEDE